MILEKKTKRTFEDSLEVGEIGEQVFVKYMDSLNNFIVDVRKVKEFQAKDIDYLVYTDDDMIAFEIKTDEQFGTMRNKNYSRFFIEDIQNVNINSNGWFRVCFADVLTIYDSINCVMYMMLMKDLREYIDLYKKDIKRMEYNTIKTGAAGYCVYINKFYQWLQDNDRYNKIVDIKEVL
jgi:uncharacterized protein YpmS